MSYRQLCFTLHFLTPAFVGDAEQNARWRTPPFKHALREWWRVAWAAKNRDHLDKDHSGAIKAMRHAEGLLFGHAWLERDFFERDGRQHPAKARKSSVLLRILPEEGARNLEDVWGGRRAQGVSPLSDGLETSYAWYGLIKRGSGLPNRNRIEANQSRQFALAWPTSYEKELLETLRLMHTFSTVGTRSRGGWGAYEFSGLEPIRGEALRRYCAPLESCLGRDWAATIACDDKPWVWYSREFFPVSKKDAWADAIRLSARLRRDIRLALKGNPDLRPALGFASPGRMPCPLRWKVVSTKQGLRLQATAMPHRLPKDSGQKMDKNDLIHAWRIVRGKLDQSMVRGEKE